MDEEIDFKQLILDEFKTPDQIGFWPLLMKKYSELGFTDPITDAQRIEEFNYIIEQTRKYVFREQKPIMAYEHDPVKMLAFVDELIEKAKEKGSDRKTLVYHALRDDWLLHLRGMIEMYLDYNKEIDDGWR